MASSFVASLCLAQSEITLKNLSTYQNATFERTKYQKQKQEYEQLASQVVYVLTLCAHQLYEIKETPTERAGFERLLSLTQKVSQIARERGNIQIPMRL